MRSSSANRGAVGPVGSNMNDAGYPFRGTYKLEKRLNHGHGGATREKSTPTSLMMKITGSNLVISQLTVPSTSSLACELGVGNERAKLIHVPVDRALEVPHDRREYNLTTIITGTGGSKHYNKLVLQSDGNSGGARSSSPLRHHTPTKSAMPASTPPPFVVISSNLGDLPPGISNPNQPRSGAYFICGNEIVKPNPSDGSFTIPTDVNPCHLVVTDPEALPMPSPPSATDAFSHTPQFITLECDPVDDSETNAAYPLNGPVVLDADGREYRCFSDRRSVVTLPTPKPGTAITLRVPKPRPTPPPPPEPLKLPEIATDVSPIIDPVTGATNQTAFTVAAAGFHIALTVAGYEPVTGFGQTSISVSSLLAHKVHITLSNPSTKERVLSQNSTIPRLNGENNLRGGVPQPSVSAPSAGGPIILKVGEQIDGMLGVGPNVKRRTVVTAVGGQSVEIAADGRPASLMLGMGAGTAIGGVTFLQPTTAAQPPAAGAESGGAHQTPPTLVQQSILLDTASSHFVDVTNKATGASCRVHFDAKVGGVEEPQWVWDLARELDDPNSALNNNGNANNNTALNPSSSQGLGVGRNRPDESLTSAISAINPQTPNGSRIISYLISRLTAPTPKFSFELKKDHSGISNIACDGFGLSYGKGSERLCHIQQGEQANFSTVGSSAAVGPPLRLVASDKNSGTRKAEVVIVGGGSATAGNAISGDGNPDVNFLDALNRALDPHCRYPDVDPRTGNLLHNEIAKIPAVAGTVAPLVKPKLMQLAKEWPGGSGTNMAFLLRLIAELNKCVGKPMTSEAMRAHMNNVAASMIGVSGGGGVGGGSALLRGGPSDTERLLLDTISELFGPPTAVASDPNATIPVKLRFHRDGPIAFSNLIADGQSLPLPHNASSSSAPSILDIEIPKTSRLVNISCGTAPPPPSDGDNLRRFLNKVVDAYNKNNINPNMHSAGVGDDDNDDKERQKRANLRRDWDGIPTTSPNGGGSDVDAPAKRILLRLLDDLDDAASRRPNNNNRNGGNCNQPVISYRVNESGTALDNVMFGLDGVLGAATTGVELWADCDGITTPFRVAQSSSVPPQEMQQQLRVPPKLIKLSIKEISTGKVVSEVSTNLTGSGIGGNGATLSSTRPNLETTISGSGEATVVRVAVLHPYKVTCRLAEEAFAMGNPQPHHQFIQGGGLSALELVYGGGDPHTASPQQGQGSVLPSSLSSVVPSQTCVRRFDCSKSHNLVITMYDGSRGGAIVGEDRLTVPRLGSSTLTLDYRDGILSYKPLPNAVVAAKFNGSTERAVTHPAIPLDVDLPHQVTISQYEIQNGAGVGGGTSSISSGARGAETSLAIPVFISKDDIERIVSIYNNYGPISPTSIAPALGELKKSAKNRVTRDLLDALIKNHQQNAAGGNGSPSDQGQGSATRRIHSSQGGGGHTTTITTMGGNAEDKMVFFRLRGEEERRRNVSSLAHVAATGGKASSNVTEPYTSGERAVEGSRTLVGSGPSYGLGYNVGRYV